MTAYKLETQHLGKDYPGTVALDGVSVGFAGGEVHALIGKNGAGKSTLVKILAGAGAPSRGRILCDGVAVDLRSPQDAFDRGIAMVYQELSLVPGLTVAENILLGRTPKRRGLIDWRATNAQARAVLARMGVAIDVSARTGDLGVAQQQVVEIAKAMSLDPQVLMLDEPTSALAQHETESLFALVRGLAREGVAIIYISHRLQELRHIADKVTVLRDGRHIGSVAMRESSVDEIVQMMFGEVVQRERPGDLRPGDAPVLEVKGLSRAGHFAGVEFALREGEILGIAGMLGAGRTELLKGIFGADACDGGQIAVAGESVGAPSPPSMKALGLAFTPENRKEEALIQAHSIRANMCLASMGKIARGRYITRAMEQMVVDEQVERLQIKVADSEDAVSSLSGGNQQKVVLGNWLGNRPRVMLFDEPTRGVDVQAKQQIFAAMWDLSREGIASIFVSTELEELIEVCHRILIMREGRIEGEVRPEDLSAEELTLRCMGEVGDGG